MKTLGLLILLASCSSLYQGSPRQGKTVYSYTDVSGTYKLNREAKVIKQKIITRNQILSSQGGKNRVLEKTIQVSQIGSIKNNKSRLLTVRPLASEFTVWLEGKKYSSRMKLDSATKSMRLTLDSPEKKWQGTQQIKFPGGKYFCFYAQMAECLYHNHFLQNARDNKTQKLEFFMIWDAYPFLQDQLTRVGHSLFAPASVKFEGEFKGRIRYIVEVEGQMILYHFTKSFDLVKMAWIAQGISIVPPGEEIADE